MGKRVVHVEFPAQDLERGRKFWEVVGGWKIVHLHASNLPAPGAQGEARE